MVMEHATEAQRLRYERDELAKLVLGEHLFEVAKSENLPILTAVRIKQEEEADQAPPSGWWWPFVVPCICVIVGAVIYLLDILTILPLR